MVYNVRVLNSLGSGLLGVLTRNSEIGVRDLYGRLQSV